MADKFDRQIADVDLPSEKPEQPDIRESTDLTGSELSKLAQGDKTKLSFTQTLDGPDASIQVSDGRTLNRNTDGSWTMSYHAGGQDKSVSVTNVEMQGGKLSYDIQSNNNSMRVTEFPDGSRLVGPSTAELPSSKFKLGQPDKSGQPDKLDEKIITDDFGLGRNKRELPNFKGEDSLRSRPFDFLKQEKLEVAGPSVQENKLPDGTKEVSIRNAEGEQFRVLTDTNNNPTLVETPDGKYRRDGDKWHFEPARGSKEGPRTFEGSVQLAPDGQITIKRGDERITYGIDGAKTTVAKDGSSTVERRVADPRQIIILDSKETPPRLQETSRYNKDGELQSRSLKDGAGRVVERTDVQKQDNGGRKEHTVSYDASGKRSVTDTHYDAEGVKTKSVDLAADGKTPIRETIYDENGKPARQVEYQKDGKTPRSETTFKEGGASERVEFGPDGKTKVATTILDESGKCVKKQEFSGDKPGEEKLTRERILVGDTEHDVHYGPNGKRTSEDVYDLAKLGEVTLRTGAGLPENELERGRQLLHTEYHADGVTRKREQEYSPFSSTKFGHSEVTTEFDEKGEPISKKEVSSRPQWEGTIRTERDLDAKTGQPKSAVSYYERGGVTTKIGEETYYENGKTKSVCAYDNSGKIKMAELHMDIEGNKISQTSFRGDGKTPLVRQYYDKNGNGTAIEGFDEQGNSTGAIDNKTGQKYPIPKAYDHERYSLSYNPEMKRMTLIDRDGSMVRSVDTNGNEYIYRGGKEYPDEKIHPIKEMYNPNLPYEDASGKRNESGEILHQRAEKLLKEAAGPGGEIDFPSHGRMLTKISEMADLTEAEKLYVYERVLAGEAEGRDPDSKPTAGALRAPGEGRYRLVNKGNLTPESGKGDFVRHVAISPTNDGYHGSLVYGGGSFSERASRGFQDGEEGIEAHERIKQGMKIGLPILRTAIPALNLVPKVRENDFGWKMPGDHYDSGDAEQSKAQIDSIRSFQESGFAGYASKWNERFVQPDKRKK